MKRRVPTRRFFIVHLILPLSSPIPLSAHLLHAPFFRQCDTNTGCSPHRPRPCAVQHESTPPWRHLHILGLRSALRPIHPRGPVPPHAAVHSSIRSYRCCTANPTPRQGRL